MSNGSETGTRAAAGSACRIGILVSSDRAKGGIYEDRGGPTIEAELRKIVATQWFPIYRLVPDDRLEIERALVELCDREQCSLVVTTGGTGPAPRDVTPEATEAVCDRLLPGFGELMRTASLVKVPTAILSRQTAGTRGKCLIVNLPGKPSAIHDCLMAVFPAIPYCVDLIGGPHIETDPAICSAFRPPQAAWAKS
jgi:molybdopterin adenylyltransferase